MGHEVSGYAARGLPRILLLNPPSARPVIRDYYCSKLSKTGYLSHPIDLLQMSGRFTDVADLAVIDAQVVPMNPDDVAREIRRFDPDAVISLVAAATIDEDLAFLGTVRPMTRRLVVSGDVVRGDTAGWLARHPVADAAVTDFTAPATLSFALHGIPGAGVVTARCDGRSHVEPLPDPYDLPVPRHDLFMSPRYRFPFARGKRYASVLTDIGCARSCSFCVMPGLGHRVRTMESVIRELERVKTLGVDELFVIDQTFGLRRERTFELLARMEPFRFGWTCFSRVDVARGDMLAAMRAGGCHTVMFGVETADRTMLASCGKGDILGTMAETFAECRALGMRTVATVIIGLPGETIETLERTKRLIAGLSPDFLSVNVAVPRQGTMLRKRLVAQGVVDAGAERMDQAGIEPSRGTGHLRPDEVAAYRDAVVRSFYLRPSYLLKRLASVTSAAELAAMARDGWRLLTG